VGAEGFHVRECGQGTSAVLLIHETGATSAVWEPLAALLAPAGRVIAYDRAGWGASPAPEGYARTTIGEQAGHAAAIVEERSPDGPVTVCGAGLGAVVALDLCLNRPDLVAGAALVEPPFLAFVPEATDGLSVDAEAMRDAAERGGSAAVLELYLSGGLTTLGAGAERLPPAARDGGPGAATALVAELGAPSAWPLPAAALPAVECPAAIVTGAGTPEVLARAAAGLAAAMPRAKLRNLDAAGAPHVAGAPALANLLTEMSST
jgi:pimeloyl-ACP methyl ester carboxylesterase